MNSFQKIIYILTNISIFTFTKSTNIIETQIHVKDNEMKIFFENYPNPITLVFNHAYTYISYSYLQHKHTDIQSYPSPQGSNEYFSDYFLFYDEFKFKESSVPFKMYFYSKDIEKGLSNQHFSNHLTFKYNQTRNKYNIVLQMHKQKVIPKPQFGLSILNSKLYFGGIPNQKYLHKVLYQKLNTTLLEKIGWYLDLSYIIIGNKEFDYSHTKYYGLLKLCETKISKTIIIPKEVMTYLKNNVFISYNKTNDCYFKKLKLAQVDNFYESGERLFCKNEITEKFPSFVFGLNNKKIEFKGKDFFDCEQQFTKDNYCLFEMNGKDTIGNNFYLCTYFFKHLVILLDYSVPSVELFDETNYDNAMYLTLFQIQKTIFCVNIILLILASIIILIIKKISF